MSSRTRSLDVSTPAPVRGDGELGQYLAVVQCGVVGGCAVADVQLPVVREVGVEGKSQQPALVVGNPVRQVLSESHDAV
ncbi:hypothetical protein [Haloarcula sp. Atlit-7R]|uniref:hypothetical protein n=1 Tax=Haloarcula sp. Atlit-7R TaxID=2282125 RepID=UPI0018F2EE86|nr:hypothetical protein [Haloarcula sp. Atlit-7R]